MSDNEARYLLDRMAERALVGLAVAVGGYLLLAGLIGERWSWMIIRAGVLVAVVFGIVSALWNAVESKAHAYELRRREIAERDRELERMDRENERLRVIAMESQGNFLHVDLRSGEAHAHFRPVAPHRLTVHQGSVHGSMDAAGIGMDAPPVPALEVVGQSLCVALVAPQGTGKTTFLQHLVEYRRTRPVIIDPHGFPGKYGDRPIVGSGRDYEAIDRAMVGILDEVDRRYLDYHRADHPMVDVFVDEATLLNQHCENFRRFVEVGLTEFRKANVRLTLCLHSRRARFLGLHGAMDLADGVDFVTLKKHGAERWGELETEDGVVRLALPGPFHGAPVGRTYQADEDVVEGEWMDSNAPTGDRDESSGTLQRIAGLIGFQKRPEGGTEQIDAILETLHRTGRAMTPAEIADAAELDKAYTRQALRRLLRAGKVANPSRGRYEVTF